MWSTKQGPTHEEPSGAPRGLKLHREPFGSLDTVFTFKKQLKTNSLPLFSHFNLYLMYYFYPSQLCCLHLIVCKERPETQRMERQQRSAVGHQAADAADANHEATRAPLIRLVLWLYFLMTFFACVKLFVISVLESKSVWKGNVTWVAVWIGQGVSAQLSSMVGWMEKLLLGGQQVGRVVQTVQRVEEVHLKEEKENKNMKQNNYRLDWAFMLVSQVHVSLFQRCGCLLFLLTSRVNSLLVYLPFISEQDRRNRLSKRAEPLASR